MIPGISKKVIFSFFLFINFIQPSKSAEINKVDNNQSFQKRFSKTSNIKIAANSSKQFFNNFQEFLTQKNFYKENLESFLASNNANQKELVIQSDQQSEDNGVIYATGNVLVEYLGKILKADNLIYDKLNKKISAQGNILLILGEQIFKISQLEYSFISEKGYLLDVKGVINTNTLIDDISSNFSLSNSKKLENLIDLNKRKL